jgi:hypothetical protein
MRTEPEGSGSAAVTGGPTYKACNDPDNPSYHFVPDAELVIARFWYEDGGSTFVRNVRAILSRVHGVKSKTTRTLRQS